MKMITSAPGRRQLCWHSLRAGHATTEVIGVGRGAVDHESDGASVHMVGGESGMGVLVREDSGAKLRLWTSPSRAPPVHLGLLRASRMTTSISVSEYPHARRISARNPLSVPLKVAS